ncbi:MAG: mannose-6-phosphate isomerase, class I [Spirochaetia bacterium]|jgi:mannose-6-phosphate isomerase|nr:mannose-6-phosphate isomerase, class I [Spirochaetia bacterium]
MKPFKLKNIIQNYSWGTTDFIPELLGLNDTGEHSAELWMGDHPRGASIALLDSEDIPLDQIKLEVYQDILGKDAERFGNNLPFLFKVLSAESPLSIQAHPTKEQAENGFLTENNKFVPLDAFNRNYKDNNHKPEIICALTTFTAMCGFKASNEIESNFIKLKSEVFKDYLQSDFDIKVENSIKSFFSTLMSLDTLKLKSLVKDALLWAGNDKSLEAKLVREFALLYDNDPGVLSPLFLNVYVLHPGEALYQGPGELHAYIKGTGIELMSNSDNVLRGGLTPKHVDVEELLKVLNFQSTGKKILFPKNILQGVSEYTTPSDEFILRYFKIAEKGTIEIKNRMSLEILLCTSGDAVLTYNTGSISISKGESILIPASLNSYIIKGSSEIYSAGIPQAQS